MDYRYTEQRDELRKQLKLLQEQHHKTNKLLKQYNEAKLELARTITRVNRLRDIVQQLHPITNRTGSCFLDDEDEPRSPNESNDQPQRNDQVQADNSGPKADGGNDPILDPPA